MFNEQEAERDVADTSTEETTEDYENTGTSEDAEESESADSSTTEQSGDDKRTRAQSQIDRLKARIKELEKGDNEGEKSGEKGQVDEKYVRLDLKTEGITNKQEQDLVLDYLKEKAARGQEVEVSDALKSMVVREELEKLRKKNSVPKPSSRTSGQDNRDLKYWAAQVKKGNFPTDPTIKRELRKMRIFNN